MALQTGIPEQTSSWEAKIDYHALFEHSLDSILLVDANGIIRTANKKLYEMSGYCADELLGQSIEILVPKRFTNHSKQMQDFMHKSTPRVMMERVDSELYMACKDGSELPVYIGLNPMTAGSEKIIVLVIRDITKQKQAEITLLENDRRFSQIMAHVEDMLWLCTNDGMEMLYVSPAYERITGRTVEEFYNNPNVWLECIHPDDLGKVINNFAECGIKGKTFTTTFRIIRTDGEERIICDSGFPILDDEGKLWRIAGAARDITEQTKAEKKMARLKRLYEYILRSAGEGIYGVDKQGKTTFINPAAADMLGYEMHELMDKSTHELIHHSKVDGSPYKIEDCPIHQAISDAKIHKADNEVFWRKDGSDFPVEYVSTPILNTNNEVTGAVVVFRDVSRKKQLETDLQMAQKLEAVGQLAAGIAHEINTPAQYVGDNIQFLGEGLTDLIAVINQYNDLLSNVKDNIVTETQLNQLDEKIRAIDLQYLLEEMPFAIAQSKQGIEHISNIVRAMKEFSHPGNDDKELVNLNHIIENTATVTKNEWKYVAELELKLDEDIPTIPGYTQTLSQVVMNLIVNAAHAIADVVGNNTGELGKITIATSKLDNGVEVTIADTGTGIPDNIKERIFDPFFTTKGVGKGTGQGLAIVHSTITDKHGGTIKCVSETGRGSTFIIFLPKIDPNIEIKKNAA